MIVRKVKIVIDAFVKEGYEQGLYERVKTVLNEKSIHQYDVDLSYVQEHSANLRDVTTMNLLKKLDKNATGSFRLSGRETEEEDGKKE